MKSATTTVIHGRRDNSIEIKVYFRLSQKQSYYNTGVKIDKQYWDDEKKDIRHSTPDFFNIYKKVTDTRNLIHKLIAELEDNKQLVTAKTLRNSFNSFHTLKHSPGQLFCEFVSYEITSSSLSDSTKKAHERTLNLLIAFNIHAKFNDIDYNFVQGFDKFLRTRFVNQNTISKHHKHLRRYVNLAGMKRLIKPENIQNYKMFRIRAIKGDKGYYSLDELNKIKTIQVSGEDENVLDMFLFSCYTGLRISDIVSLENKHIKLTKHGHVLEKVMNKLAKHNKSVKLPLYSLFNGDPEIIYYKYRNDGQYLFPRISENKIRLRLKVILDDEKVKFHTARHTFLTILAWKTGNVFTVMNLGGISSISTAQTYINIASEYVNDSLNNIVW